MALQDILHEVITMSNQEESIRRLISIFPCPLNEEWRFYWRSSVVRRVIDAHVQNGCEKCQERIKGLKKPSLWQRIWIAVLK